MVRPPRAGRAPRGTPRWRTAHAAARCLESREPSPAGSSDDPRYPEQPAGLCPIAGRIEDRIGGVRERLIRGKRRAHLVGAIAGGPRGGAGRRRKPPGGGPPPFLGGGRG